MVNILKAITNAIFHSLLNDIHIWILKASLNLKLHVTKK